MASVHFLLLLLSCRPGGLRDGQGIGEGDDTAGGLLLCWWPLLLSWWPGFCSCLDGLASAPVLVASAPVLVASAPVLVAWLLLLS